MRGGIAVLVLVSAGQSGCRIAAAMLQGAGCGVSSSSCKEPAASSAQSAATNDATRRAGSSDYSCEYGWKCVKAPYRTDGYCARAVDEYGLPTYAAPASQSVMPGGQGQCGFDTDCPVPFYCAIEPGSIRG